MHPTAAALAQCEWLLSGPRPRATSGDAALTQMFARAGVGPPTHVTGTDAMAGIALVRNSNLISVFPARLLAERECRDIVEVPIQSLVLPDIQLVQVALVDVAFTPAAAYFSRCLVDASAVA